LWVAVGGHRGYRPSPAYYAALRSKKTVPLPMAWRVFLGSVWFMCWFILMCWLASLVLHYA
jgi:hypothetical protein